MKPTESIGTIAITDDGGKTWNAGALPGYRSSVSCRDSSICVATGTSGSDYSSDGGRSWKAFGMEGYNAIGGFAVGPDGRIATLVLPAPR
jgi:photosystem II stability/assembly factor-like uncharacterized protein